MKNILKIAIYFAAMLLVFHEAKADLWNGFLYKETMRSQGEDGDLLLSMIDNSGQEDSHVQILDVGCGNGENTKKLFKKFSKAHVTGIDPSSSMIDYAKKHKYYFNVDYIHTSVEDYKKPNQLFDYVISIHTLHWVKDIKKGLSNIFQSLKAKGQGYFLFAASKEGLPYQIALNKAIKESFLDDFKNFVNPQHFYTIEEFEQLLKEAGFKVVISIKKLNTRFYDSPETLKKWIAQWSPYRKALPTEKQEDFMNTWMKHYLANLSSQESSSILWEEYVIIFNVIKP